MQVTLNKLNDTLLLNVSINPEDYKDKLEKLIIKKKKTVEINGFRKGQVPINIIRNKYEETLKIQCIEKLLNQYIYEYIYKEKIKTLGDILLVKQKSNDSENMSFQFEIGIMPELNLEINNLDIYYYNIKISNELLNKYVKNFFYTKKNEITTSEEDLRDTIQLAIEKIYSIKSDELLIKSLISTFLKTTKIILPKHFLQRWIQNKYSMSIEEAKYQYKNIESQIYKQLIKNKLYELYNLKEYKINHDQWKKINNSNLENMIKKIINYDDNIKISLIYENISIIKEKLKIQDKTCSLDEFNKIFQKISF